MRSPDDDRRDDDEAEGRPKTRAEELDIPLEEVEKLAAEQGGEPGTDLDSIRIGSGSD